MPSRKTTLLLTCQHCGYPFGPIIAQLAVAAAAIARLSVDRLQPSLGGEYAAFVAMKRIFNAQRCGCLSEGLTFLKEKFYQ
jgi:hypothetical protein